MKRLVEIEPICPFIGKECIKDGWKYWDQKIVRPCAFWDGDNTYDGVPPEEPCRIKRAMNRILSDETPDKPDENRKVLVPF